MNALMLFWGTLWKALVTSSDNQELFLSWKTKVVGKSIIFVSFSLINLKLSCFYKVLQPRMMSLYLHFHSYCEVQGTLCGQAPSVAAVV